MKRYKIQKFKRTIGEGAIYRHVYESGEKQIHCDQCKKEIQKKRANKRFCSNNCKSKWYYEMKRDIESGVSVMVTGAKKECPACGTEMRPGTAIYCNETCQEKAMESKKNVTCRCCNKRFKSKRRNATFCTPECKAEYFNRIKREATAERKHDIKMEKRRQILAGLKKAEKYDFLG